MRNREKLYPTNPEIPLRPEAKTETELVAVKLVHVECITIIMRLLKECPPRDRAGELAHQAARNYLQDLKRKP